MDYKVNSIITLIRGIATEKILYNIRKKNQEKSVGNSLKGKIRNENEN